MLSCRGKIIRSAYALVETAAKSKRPFASTTNFIPPSTKKFEEKNDVQDASLNALESAKKDIKCSSSECGDRGFSNGSHRNNSTLPNAAKKKSDEYYYRYPRDDQWRQNVSFRANEGEAQLNDDINQNSHKRLAEEAEEAGINNAWEKAKDVASDAWESAKETASNVAESVKNAASVTKDKTKELYHDSKEAVKDNLAELKDAVKDGYEDKLHSAKETWHDAKNMAKDKYEDIKSTVSEQSHEGLKRGEDVASKVESASREGLDDISKSFHETYNAATGNLPRAKPTVGVGYAGAEAARNQKLMDVDPYRAETIYEGRTLRPEVMDKCGKADKSGDGTVLTVKEKAENVWEDVKKTTNNAWGAAKKKLRSDDKDRS